LNAVGNTLPTTIRSVLHSAGSKTTNFLTSAFPKVLMNVVTGLMEDGMDTKTGSKNTTSPKTSLEFNSIVVTFLLQWSILSISIVLVALLK
jgi:hypothetical protein